MPSFTIHWEIRRLRDNVPDRTRWRIAIPHHVLLLSDDEQYTYDAILAGIWLGGWCMSLTVAYRFHPTLAEER